MLKLFAGNVAAAKALALLDDDQYVVVDITAYVGEPEKRSDMWFKTRFEEGTHMWVKFSQDIATTEAYENFCEGLPQLKELLQPAAQRVKFITKVSKGLIKNIKSGTVCYVDIRYFDAMWAYALGLPDFESTMYVVKAIYKRIEGESRKIEISFKRPQLRLGIRYLTSSLTAAAITNHVDRSVGNNKWERVTNTVSGKTFSRSD
jgi:hypothetical protein